MVVPGRVARLIAVREWYNDVGTNIRRALGSDQQTNVSVASYGLARQVQSTRLPLKYKPWVQAHMCLDSLHNEDNFT